LNRIGQDRRDQDRTGQNRDRIQQDSQDGRGPDRTGQNGTGLNWIGQDGRVRT
jgi:hypothetical protein